VSSRRDRLGKGLGALIGEALGPVQETEVRRLRVDAIVPNPLQPRQEFSEKELEELSESIRQNGLMQPITVRPSRSASANPGYELVAGERRLRAVRRLGWDEVSAVVRDVDDDALLVLALVENLQREALDPLEEAEGFKALQDRFSMTQEEIARAVGRERSTVANLMRLLKLPPSIRKLVKGGKLSMGHARALLGIEDPGRVAELGRRAAEEGWSVREVERRASLKKAERAGNGKQRAPSSSDPIVHALEEALRERLSTRVLVRGVARGKGTIEIPFDSDEEFERLFALIAGREASEVVG
jgi:ParB family transcriptional regulator, chromosome partitioning protein